MRSRNKKIFAGSMAAVLLLGASSLAWFTDRTGGSIEGQAGDLCLNMTEISGDLDNLAPGDNRELSFAYANSGSVSMDTRVTYALSYELDEEVAHAIENDLDVIATLDIDGNELQLTSDDDVVMGTFESGTIKGTDDNVGEDRLSHTLNFNFDKSVGNIGQKMKFKLEVLVEGKQNELSPSWEQVHKTTIEFGNQELNVVPVSACNIYSDIEGPVIVLEEAFDITSQQIVSERHKKEVSHFVTITYKDGEEESIRKNFSDVTDASDIVEGPIILGDLISEGRDVDEIDKVTIRINLYVGGSPCSSFNPGTIHEEISLDKYDSNVIELKYSVFNNTIC